MAELRPWWENDAGEAICHLCDEPVEPTGPDTWYGISGAPVHESCAKAANRRHAEIRSTRGRRQRGSCAA